MTLPLTPSPVEGEKTAWKPIQTAPYGVVILVRNKLTEKPVRATRGYVHNGSVHPDQTFCTSVYTPDEFFPFPGGKLVCPDEWCEFSAEGRAARKDGA